MASSYKKLFNYMLLRRLTEKLILEININGYNYKLYRI